MAKKRGKDHSRFGRSEVTSSSAPEGQGRRVITLAVWMCLATYTLALAVRLVEAPLWLQDPGLRVGQGMVLATHDGYFWLAGAEGRLSTAPFAQRTAVPDLLALLSRMTGLAPSLLGFWLPAVMAPLAAVPVCLLTARWRMPEAGLWAGLMAATAPGYWQRTRLGFLDDDFLLIPVLLALVCGAAVLLTPYVREKWLGPAMEKRVTGRDAFVLLVGAVLLGWWAWLCVWIYPKSFILVLATAGMAFCLALFTARPGARVATAGASVLLFTAWFGPWWATVAGMAGLWGLLLGWKRFYPEGFGPWLSRPYIGLGLLGACAVMAAMIGRGAWLPHLASIQRRVLFFYQATSTEDTHSAVFLGNVSEAINLPFWATSYHLSGHWSLLLLGSAGFGLLLWKRPTSLVFAPLAGIAVLAFFLGARFSVYSASVFGLGVGCGFVLLLERLEVTPRRRILAVIVLLPMAFWPLSQGLKHSAPMPVVSERLVRAFQGTSDIAARNALVWTNWDLGAAAFYYTGLQAVEMRLVNEGVFSAALAEDSPKRARDRILARGADREHYVLVVWEELAKLENLLATGTFDPRTGTSARQGKVFRLTHGVGLDMHHGLLVMPDETFALEKLDQIAPSGLRRHAWPQHDPGHHAVLNLHDRTGYLLDAEIAKTLYARLLIGPPEAVAPEFELVVDDFPWVRVFRVQTSGQ